MRRSVLATAALLCLSFSAPARAQFANRSLGFQAGFLDMNNVTGGQLSWGIPIGLTASLYIENGFDVLLGAGLMVVHDPFAGTNILALDGPSAGIRYLILQESLRPYVGLDLSYLHIFSSSTTADFVGLAPNAGVDYFVSDSVSVGLRARFNLYFSLNAFWYAPAANVSVATYF